MHSQLRLTVMAATSDVSMKVITSGCVGLPAPGKPSFAVIDGPEAVVLKKRRKKCRALNLMPNSNCLL